MKKILLTIVVLLANVLVAFADNISVADVVIPTGKTATADIYLNNSSTNLVGFQMDVTLPEGISINKAGCSLSSRFADADQGLTIGKLGNNVYRLTSTSLSLIPITGSSGKIITLSLQASSTSQGGTATIKNIRFVTSNSERITLNDVSFNINIKKATLAIKATGNGYANFNGTSVRNTTKTFTVDEGASATISFTPDDGYRIKSVKKDGTNVTSSVSNGQYTVSNIQGSTTVEVEFEAIPPTTYTLTIKATGNGSASYNSTTVRNATKTFTVNQGSSATIGFTPDTGYRIKSVKKDGTNVTSSISNGQYTVSNIQGNTTVEVEFEAITHTLSITAMGNGSAYYNSTTIRNTTKTFTVNEGTSVTVSFTPDDGYRIKSVKLNSTNVTSSVTNNKYTISNITTDVSLEVEFEAITHTLSIKATGNGSAYYNSTTVRNTTEAFTVNEGVSATVSFTPDDGYRIKSVKLNSTNVTSSVANNKYTISNITADVSLEVEFESITHTLSITATGNGSASYNSTIVRNATKTFTVNEGTSATISFTPDAGYRIKSVKKDGTNVTSSVSNNQYTISNIHGDTTVEVEFEAIIHTLSITATGNGSAFYNSTTVRNATKTFTVNEGTSVTIGFTPDTGYRIKSVKLNSTNVTSSVTNNQYTVSNITADVSLEVEFEAIPPTTYTLTITSTGNGSTSYNSTIVRNATKTFTVNEGSSVTIGFTPDTGYRIKSVKKDGTNVTSNVSNGQYTVSNIQGNTTVEVEFEAITHMLTITSTGNGSASFGSTSVRNGTNTFTVNEGSSVTISFSPEAGYRIRSVKKDGMDVTSSVTNGQYTLSNIQGNTTVEVEFEAITHTLTITAIGNGSASYNSTTVSNTTKTFTVNEGSSATISFAPDTGYRIKSVKRNGTNVTSRVFNNKYTISNIQGNTTVEVEFEAITHTLTITATGNGSASYNSTTVRNATKTFIVNEGTSATIGFMPDDGNRVKSVKLNSVNITSSVINNQYIINTITADASLEVEFEAISHTLSITANGNGSASYNSTTIRNTTKTFTVNEGNSATISFIPDDGYRIRSVKKDGTNVTGSVINDQYTVSNIKSNTTVEVEFEAIPPTTYTLTITSSGNGSASYNSTTVRNATKTFTVNEGTSATISFMPDDGYRIKSVKLNSTNVTSSVTNNEYTISNVTASANLEVEFEAILPTYILTIKAMGNGSASYNSTTIRNTSKTFIINKGTSATVSFFPDDGYHIKSVKLNSTNVTSSVRNNEYIISNITASTNLEVEFEAIPPTYMLTVKAAGNGSAFYNSTTIRNTTKTFVVNEGTSATISFTPDVGYRIKSVKHNSSNVTSSITNNEYTISNITESESLEVEFETIPPTMCMLTIAAQGNGAAVCEDKSIRSGRISLSIEKGMSTIVYFTPDDGYRIKSVMKDGVDVTSNVLDNQYAITNLQTDVSIEVEFEVITHTLSIHATGNGTATFDDLSIRNATNAFVVNEGTTATVLFLADEGHKILSVKKDGVDVTAAVVNNQFTADNIQSDVLVEVEFVARPTTCTYETVNYEVQSFADMTVLVTHGDYGRVLEVPATISFDGTSWRVNGLEKDALANSPALAAVIWHPAAAFAATLNNPNLLLYVEEAAYAPATIGNVVVKGVADNIVLTDAASGNDFFCPQEFTARRISYSHRYSMETGMDEARGWETIALPFDVQRIVHESKGEIVPFAQRNSDDSRRPFWLMAFTDKGWTAADGIKANTPYIISMPNHPDYYSDYLLSGTVAFESENVAVMASDDMKPSQQGDKTFIPTYCEIGIGEGAFALNVSNDLEQNTSGVADGSRFVLNMRRVHPFEAYMKSSTTRSPWIGITEDMENAVIQGDDRVGVFSLGGQLLKRCADEADALRPLRSGVYIVNRKKVIVK